MPWATGDRRFLASARALGEAAPLILVGAVVLVALAGAGYLRGAQDTRTTLYVAVAANVLEEQGMHGVPLIGIAKGPERKPGDEDIVFPGRDDVLKLPSDHPGLHLLQQIRDEAHRFAIQGHRARRAKARTTSTLQEIEGVGAKKRQALLAHFGGLKGVQAAGVDDLAREGQPAESAAAVG